MCTSKTVVYRFVKEIGFFSLVICSSVIIFSFFLKTRNFIITFVLTNKISKSVIDNIMDHGVVPQSDLSSTIIISYNDLDFLLRLTACSTKISYLTVIVG